MKEIGYTVRRLPEGVRIQKRGKYTFAFNFSPHETEVEIPDDARIVLGDRKVEPYSLVVWEEV
nr:MULTISPECIES: Beta-galactosidase C-terminal domain [unclassified Thermotoga]